MKTKLFSKRSLLVSLKGLATSVVAYLCALPLWLVTMVLLKKELFMIGGLFGIFTFIVSFLFFGFFGSRWWGWK